MMVQTVQPERKGNLEQTVQTERMAQPELKGNLEKMEKMEKMDQYPPSIWLLALTPFC